MQINKTLVGNDTIKQPITGRYIVAYQADSDFEVSGRGIESVRMRQGATMDLGMNFAGNEVVIKNLSAANNAIDLEVSALKVTISDNKELTVNTTATVQGGDDNTHLPIRNISSGLSAVLAVANGSRKYLRIALPSDAVGPITLGKSGVSAAAGGLLEPGMVDYMETEGALYAFNDNDDPVDVYVMEINKL